MLTSAIFFSILAVTKFEENRKAKVLERDVI
jgi:hypothetical protein